jgi:CheY-like chemotaxis protein
MMPDMKGLMAVQTLQATNTQVKAIATSRLAGGYKQRDRTIRVKTFCRNRLLSQTNYAAFAPIQVPLPDIIALGATPRSFNSFLMHQPVYSFLLRTNYL